MVVKKRGLDAVLVVGWKALSGDETLTVAGTEIRLRVAVSKLRLNNDINDVRGCVRSGGFYGCRG